jgi:hypothetical protein
MLACNLGTGTPNKPAIGWNTATDPNANMIRQYLTKQLASGTGV